MQQHSTEQRSTVDSRRHLTNFKMLVSHSMSAVLDSLSNNCQIKCSKCPVNSWFDVEDAVKISNISGFSTFISTYRRWDGSLCVCVHREFSHKSVDERILKIGPHLSKLLSNIKWLPFFGTQCIQSNMAIWCTHVALSNKKNYSTNYRLTVII